MYGCRGSCSGSYRPKPFYRINHVSPDRPEALYAKAHDIMDMYKKLNKADIKESGGFYRPGPNPSLGYAPGTANSGTYSMLNSYMDQISGAREKYDFSRTFG